MKQKTLIIVLSVLLVFSVVGNAYQYTTNRKLNEQSAALQTDIASHEAKLSELTEQISELQSTVDAQADQKKIYWVLAVDDYEISLREGSTEDTLNLMHYQNEKEKLLLTFEKDYDYQTPEDISAESFEECLGHNGFRLYQRRSLGESYHYYEVNYYAVEEEVKLLAYRWGSRDDDFYEADIDGDGIKELICNVMWMADGALDVLIYHFDGEKVLKGRGSDLLDEPADIHGVGSVSAQYLPETEKVHIDYWLDSLQDFQGKDYNIELDKIDMSDYIK